MAALSGPEYSDSSVYCRKCPDPRVGLVDKRGILQQSPGTPRFDRATGIAHTETPDISRLSWRACLQQSAPDRSHPEPALGEQTPRPHRVPVRGTLGSSSAAPDGDHGLSTEALASSASDQEPTADHRREQTRGRSSSNPWQANSRPNLLELAARVGRIGRVRIPWPFAEVLGIVVLIVRVMGREVLGL